MITVAAMLSAEHVFSAGHGPDVGNGLAPQAGLDGTAGPAGRGSANDDAKQLLKALVNQCQGDHIILLKLFQMWQAAGFSKEFCRQYGLDVRGMNFARDIRRQLEGEQQPCSAQACTMLSEGMLLTR